MWQPVDAHLHRGGGLQLLSQHKSVCSLSTAVGGRGGWGALIGGQFIQLGLGAHFRVQSENICKNIKCYIVHLRLLPETALPLANVHFSPPTTPVPLLVVPSLGLLPLELQTLFQLVLGERQPLLQDGHRLRWEEEKDDGGGGRR